MNAPCLFPIFHGKYSSHQMRDFISETRSPDSRLISYEDISGKCPRRQTVHPTLRLGHRPLSFRPRFRQKLILWWWKTTIQYLVSDPGKWVRFLSRKYAPVDLALTSLLKAASGKKEALLLVPSPILLTDSHSKMTWPLETSPRTQQGKGDKEKEQERVGGKTAWSEETQ